MEAFGARTVRPQTDFENDLGRLNNMITEARKGDISLSAARDEARRESSHASPSYSAPPPYRPFQLLVTAQKEKNRRDRQYRDRLHRERRLEQQRSDRLGSSMDRAMAPPKPAAAVKHQKGKLSMTGFLRAVRPSSIAWGSDRNLARHRTASELDFPAQGKPFMALSLNDATVTVFDTSRPFVFVLLTEDGGRWLLQTTSLSERDAWMQTISVASRKRSTYMPNAIKPPNPDPVALSSGRPGAGELPLSFPPDDILTNNSLSIWRTSRGLDCPGKPRRYGSRGHCAPRP